MNLLIVDDEYYTVESISNKIRTLRPDFFEIFCAYFAYRKAGFFGFTYFFISPSRRQG